MHAEVCVALQLPWESIMMLSVTFSFFILSILQVGLVDLDICGPSVPKLMAVEGKQVINSPYGWTPLK